VCTGFKGLRKDDENNCFIFVTVMKTMTARICNWTSWHDSP